MANIRSYVHQIETLYVVNNSDVGDPILERELIALGNVIYLANLLKKDAAPSTLVP